MKRFLLGLLCGVMLSAACVPRVQLQPVLTVTVPQECPDFKELPYILDGTISDDDIVCVSLWRDQPLEPLKCLKVGELKAMLAALGKS